MFLCKFYLKENDLQTNIELYSVMHMLKYVGLTCTDICLFWDIAKNNGIMDTGMDKGIGRWQRIVRY